jgi:predicted DNA-binding transcriptional regulator AlpA
MSDLLKTKDVLEALKISRTTLHHGIKAGVFPAPLKLTVGKRANFWRKADIQSVIMQAVSRVEVAAAGFTINQ